MTGLTADRDISVRQAIGEDPESTDEPRLQAVTADDLPGDLVAEMADFACVRSSSSPDGCVNAWH